MNGRTLVNGRLEVDGPRPRVQQARPTPAPVAARSRRRRAETLLLLGALAAMGPAAIDMYVPALPRIAADLDVSVASTQLTLTTFLIGLGFGQVVAGRLSDVFGRRPPLLASIAVYAAAGVACALATALPVLACARFAQGLAAAAGIVISRAIVRDLYSGPGLARSYSRLYLIVGVAPIVAPVVGTQVLRFTSWRGIFMILFCFAAALLVAAALRLAETLPPERRTPAGVRSTATAFRSLLAHRGLIGYAVTLGCGTGALVAAIAGAPFVVQDVYGESPQVYGFLVLLGGLAVVTANQLNARLLRTLSSERLLLLGLAAAALAGCAMLAAGNAALGAFVACFVGLFAAYGFVLANATALALREQAALAGSAAALLGLVQYGTGALAAPLAGLVGGGRVVPLGIVVSCFALTGTVGALVTAAGDRRPRVSELL
jgi:MFS transporter, DHA1 family, multidrug resistance protein